VKLLQIHRAFFRRLRARNCREMTTADDGEGQDAAGAAQLGGNQQKIDYTQKWEGYICS
jgi:hypothetical protein